MRNVTVSKFLLGALTLTANFSWATVIEDILVTGQQPTYTGGNPNYNNISTPVNRTMYGTTYSSAAYQQMQQAKAAAKKQCEATVKKKFFDECAYQAEIIQSNDHKACSTQIAVGATSAAVGGVVAGAVAGVVIVASAPVSVPIIVLGSVGLVGLGGGTYAASVGANECKDDANLLFKENVRTCETLTPKAVAKACGYM